jgi:CDP-glucose 4,6-dehydratase
MTSFWRDRTAFVTGATGFVGAHIVRLLLERNVKVVCLQRDASRANLLDTFDLRHSVTVVNGAVDDFALCSQVLTQYEIDAVFHLAAQPLVGVANLSPLATFESNIRGTYSLLEACRQSHTVTRIVVASSGKASPSYADLSAPDDVATQRLFPYDVSKLCTDLIARSFAHTYDLPVSITRSANIYGPGDMHLSRIIPGTIDSILNGDNPIIRSDGTPIREFVYVDDIAEASLLLAENIDHAKGNAYTFGTGEPITILDLVTTIVELSGNAKQLTPQVLLTPTPVAKADAQYLPPEKHDPPFGWIAKSSLIDGLKRTIEWYAMNRSKR